MSKKTIFLVCFLHKSIRIAKVGLQLYNNIFKQRFLFKYLYDYDCAVSMSHRDSFFYLLIEISYIFYYDLKVVLPF
jgi:hypothetical protein